MEILGNIAFVTGILFFVMLWTDPKIKAYKIKRKLKKTKKQLMDYAENVQNPNCEVVK